MLLVYAWCLNTAGRGGLVFPAPSPSDNNITEVEQYSIFVNHGLECSIVLSESLQQELHSDGMHGVQVPDDSFAFLVDADFVLMKDFATKLKQGAPGSLLRYAADAWTERSERHAVIVPAFQREPDDSLPGEEKVKLPNADATHACAPSLQDIEPGSDCWMYNQYDVPLTKDALHRMLDDGSITGFYEDKVCTVQHALCTWCKHAGCRLEPLYLLTLHHVAQEHITAAGHRCLCCDLIACECSSSQDFGHLIALLQLNSINLALYDSALNAATNNCAATGFECALVLNGFAYLWYQKS